MGLFKEKALKCTRLKELRCHEYYRRGTKSKAISVDKYCTNEFHNLKIPNKISGDLHNKKNTHYFMYSGTQRRRRRGEGSASPRQWTPSSKPSSQSLAPLQSLLKWIHFFVPMHWMWLRGHLTTTWCVPAEEKTTHLDMLTIITSNLEQCN